MGTNKERVNMKQTCLMAHHWIYDSPNGTYSEGVCIYCGARQKALNCMPQDLKKKDKMHPSFMRNYFYVDKE